MAWRDQDTALILAIRHQREEGYLGQDEDCAVDFSCRSIAHHAMCLVQFCSVTAGALLQLKGGELNGIAAVLTTLAAALTSLAAAGGFERK
jgi:hypothetical protein